MTATVFQRAYVAVLSAKEDDGLFADGAGQQSVIEMVIPTGDIPRVIQIHSELRRHLVLGYQQTISLNNTNTTDNPRNSKTANMTC